MFGTLLKHTLDEVGICSKSLRMDRKCGLHWHLCIRCRMGTGSFLLSEPRSRYDAEEEEVDLELIRNTKIFHFGTLSMTHEGVRNATKKAICCAKEAGAMISFDPNLREPLWESLDLAKEQMEYGFRQCDVLKISDNEIQFVTGQEDYDKGIRMLQEKYHIPLILLTMGKEGSRAYYKEMCVEKAGFV